jgi:hypothetical protein
MPTSVKNIQGIGTERAYVEAEVTKENVREYCENWASGSDRMDTCLKENSVDIGKVQRAEANCPALTVQIGSGERYRFFKMGEDMEGVLPLGSILQTARSNAALVHATADQPRPISRCCVPELFLAGTASPTKKKGRVGIDLDASRRVVGNDFAAFLDQSNRLRFEPSPKLPSLQYAPPAPKKQLTRCLRTGCSWIATSFANFGKSQCA